MAVSHPSGARASFAATQWTLSCAPYAHVAAQLGITEGAVKVTVYRMRRRFRDLLRAEVAETVETADLIDDEIRYLMSVIHL